MQWKVQKKILVKKNNDIVNLSMANYLLIIDEFKDGLKLIEIESDDKNLILNFEPFDWFGKEVTDDIRYTNNWIAYDRS